MLQYQQQQQQQQLPQQQQQQQQQHDQHPFLAAISGNNYADFGQPRVQGNPYHPYYQHRPQVVGAGSSANGIYTASAHSGHGGDSSSSGPSGYEGSQHPSGGGYSYHGSIGGDYDSHSPPTAHHSPPPSYYSSHSSTGDGGGSSGKAKKKGGGSSAMTALTLLSFFFFVNLLQNCLQDHTMAVNPTVMVLAVRGARNRNNKLAEMNPREQNQQRPVKSNSASSVNQGSDTTAPGVSTNEADIATATIPLPSPIIKLDLAPTYNVAQSGTFAGGLHHKPAISNYNANSQYNGNQYDNNNNNNVNQHGDVFSTDPRHQPTTSSTSRSPIAVSTTTRPAQPELHDSMHSFPNRSYLDATHHDWFLSGNNQYNQHQHQHPYQHPNQHQHQHQQQDYYNGQTMQQQPHYQQQPDHQYPYRGDHQLHHHQYNHHSHQHHHHQQQQDHQQQQQQHQQQEQQQQYSGSHWLPDEDTPTGSASGSSPMFTTGRGHGGGTSSAAPTYSSIFRPNAAAFWTPSSVQHHFSDGDDDGDDGDEGYATDQHNRNHHRHHHHYTRIN